MRRLIVNADDFGLTPGVNRAIHELHTTGVVTSTTLMARAGGSGDAIAIARSTPGLGVGCHVVLVDGEPVLSPHEIPCLADPVNGQFRRSLGQFLQWVYGVQGPAFQPEEIEGEAAAQIRFLLDRGIELSHIDTHKHTHMFPPILRPVLRAARSAGIQAVRNPFEPGWSLRATAGATWIRRAEVSLLRRTLEATFQRIVAEEGFRTTDGAIGVLATGTLDSAILAYLLREMREGTWELVTHPGYNDDALKLVHTRLRESRETERRALETIGQLSGCELISFVDLLLT